MLHEYRRGVSHLVNLPIKLPTHLARLLIQRGDVAKAGIMLIEYNYKILK